MIENILIVMKSIILLKILPISMLKKYFFTTDYFYDFEYPLRLTIS
jgi:hypothetical protein